MKLRFLKVYKVLRSEQPSDYNIKQNISCIRTFGYEQIALDSDA